jgi:hypothetical protein
MAVSHPWDGHTPIQFMQWRVDIFKSWFGNYQSPTAEQFVFFINQCADAIECHKHLGSGGPGSGTGHAGPIAPPEWITDEFLYNLWAFRRRLTVEPPVGANFIPTTWQGGEGELLTTPTACDRNHIYVGLETSPAQVLKLRRDTLRHVGTWTAREGENTCRALILHNGFLYAAVQHSSMRVIKISPAAMERIDYCLGTPEDQNCVALAAEGKFLYAGQATSPARVRRIRASNMTREEAWEGESGENVCSSVIMAFNCLFAGLATAPAKVVRIYRSNMNTDEIWTGDTGQDRCRALAHDSQYLYAGLGTEPARVVQILPDELTSPGQWHAAQGQNDCRALACSKAHFFVGLNTRPAQIVKVRPGNMAEVGSWTGLDFDPREEAIIEEALALIAQSSAACEQYDSITSKDIDVAFGKLEKGCYAMHLPAENRIVVNLEAENESVKVIAAVIVHEGEHTRWLGKNSINQEYHAYKAQAEFWNEVRGGETHDFCDFVADFIALGKHEAMDFLRQYYPCYGFPDFSEVTWDINAAFDLCDDLDVGHPLCLNSQRKGVPIAYHWETYGQFSYYWLDLKQGAIDELWQEDPLEATVAALGHLLTRVQWDEPDSIDQEYYAFQTMAQIWNEVKGALSHTFCNTVAAVIAQGEAAAKNWIRSRPEYADLPEHYP